MLCNHAGGRHHGVTFTERPHQSEGDGRKRNALHRRRLTKSRVHRWHGLATFLTMMTV